MGKPSKRMRANHEALGTVAPLPLAEAVAKVKSFKAPKFDQTVEVCMHLGIDPRQAEQQIRGAIALPHGVGQSKRVVAFCSPDKVDECKAAGAIEAGGEDIVAKINGGWLDFDVAVAEPAMMRVVAPLGRALGPKGLMPSPKSGTVAQDVVTAVKEYGAGKVEYRNDSGGNIHAPVGKFSFDAQQLVDNAEMFIKHITKLKPASAKGHYIKRITLSATMTPGVQVEE